MRFTVAVQDIEVTYRGLGRNRKRMDECVLLLMDIAKARDEEGCEAVINAAAEMLGVPDDASGLEG